MPTSRNLAVGFQCAVVCGLLGGLILTAWEPIVVTLGAAATVLVASRLVSSKKGNSAAGAASLGGPGPANRGGTGADGPGADDGGDPAAPDATGLKERPPEPKQLDDGPIRLPMYQGKDWDFAKPWWQMDITQQYLYRPTPERTVEPLGVREKFVKYWAQDADAFAVKDRFCIPKGGTRIIQQRF